MRKRLDDPLCLKGRQRRIRPLVSSLLIGGAVLSLSYRDTQAAIGEQRRETFLTQHILSKADPPLDEVLLSVAIFLVPGAGTSWAVPLDWNSQNNSVECIGAGASGGVARNSAGVTAKATGGGAGAYAKVSNVALTPTSSVTINVGVGGASVSVSAIAVSNGLDGTSTWFNGASLAASTVGAEGGKAGQASLSAIFIAGGIAGSAANSIGITKYSGGRGGDDGTGTATQSTGGGGAAGLNGAGNNGGDLAASTSGATVGGSADAGLGGAGGATASNGGNGTEWDATHGSGGGGGGHARTGAIGTLPGNGGNYGGGGGSGARSSASAATDISGTGANGLIVIIYVPRSLVPFRRVTRFFTRNY